MRISFVSATLLAGLFIIGCGGSTGTNIAPNPLADAYLGTGSASGSTDSFQASITITPIGTFSGTITDTNTNTVSPISGSVSATGTVSNAALATGMFDQSIEPLTGSFTVGVNGKATGAALSASPGPRGSTNFTFSDLVARTP